MSILFIDLYRLCIYITHLHTITRFLLDVFFYMTLLKIYTYLCDGPVMAFTKCFAK